MSLHALLWDDRFEAPADPLKPLFPPLAEGEVPSYDVHIEPIVKRYCISCHRAGKDNNDYLMTTYEEILTTGENMEKNIIAGDGELLPADHSGNSDHDPENGEEIIGVMPPKGNAQAGRDGCLHALDHERHAANCGRGSQVVCPNPADQRQQNLW
jgi:hypothetical protein